MIKVSVPGLQTTVQDAGRPGYYAMGLPPAGALDQRSFRIGNILVGNHQDAASLEFTFMGPMLEFQSDALIAITGAELAVFIDGEAQKTWTSLRVKKGQVLSFGPMTRGSRGYIAIHGGINVPKILGSRSTYQPVGLGGHQGRALMAGDMLEIGEQSSDELHRKGEGRTLDVALRPTLDSHIELAVVPGLCHYRFTQESVDEFFSTQFQVSHEANRTGFRLIGPTFEFVPREVPFGAGDDPSNVVNLGYPLGSIQIPSGTEPICLLRDAVTGGGYVTFGTIVSTELDNLAQLKSPETVSFRPVDAQTARMMREREFTSLSLIEQSFQQSD